MTRWPFDIEILARFTQTRQGASLKQVEDIVYKFPLYEWCGVASSKKAWNFLRVLYEPAVIHRGCLRLLRGGFHSWIVYILIDTKLSM